MSTEETPTPTPAPTTGQALSEAPTSAQAQQPAPAPAPASAPVPVPVPASAQAKLSPRSGPIVAGTLVLILCAYVVVQTMGGRVDATTWAIGTILGLGALLLLVGIAVLARGARGSR